MTKAMNISRLVALLGSVITLAQIFLLASDQQGICLNDGCEVVDSLTAVPPIVINMGGFIFFQLIFWGTWLARRENSHLFPVQVILLAALAAEGVLVSFQQYVAQTFCSYCVIIFGFIVVLNILAGRKQILLGGAVFCAVLLGFTSLQFSGAAVSPFEQLDSGTYALLQGEEEGEKRYLFFSSSCQYCEKVIGSLSNGVDCDLRFNPLDQIADFALKDVRFQESYDPAVNIRALKSLGIEQIPMLLVRSKSEYRVISGRAAIQRYLDRSCLAGQTDKHETFSQVQQQASVGFSPSNGLDFLSPQDDACAVDTDCEDPSALPPKQ